MLQLIAMLLLRYGGTQPMQVEARFDVVSVKLDPPASGGNYSGGPRPKDPGFIAPDNWTCVRMPVSRILTIAFDTSENDMVGLPKWTDQTWIEINAKLPAANHGQLPAMLRTMFADRFHLISHRASQVTDVRWIEVAKGGIKLKPASQACSEDASVPHTNVCCAMPGYARCLKGMEWPGLDCSNPPLARCGDVARFADWPNEQYGVDYSGVDATMGDLARGMTAAHSGAPWVDHTDIEGRFDFLIKIDMTPPPAPLDGPAMPHDIGSELRAATERAFRDQAGLQISFDKSHKEAYPVLVIDHIELPSGN